ncbi:MAG: hypothetical protein GXO14_02185 [Thermococci archaeon]|nr:hypothetical protein [Thermococci archaeon]
MVDIISLLRSKRNRDVEFARDVLVEAMKGHLNGGPLFKDAIEEAYSIIKDAAFRQKEERLIEAYERMVVLKYLSVERDETPIGIMQEVVSLLEQEEEEY